MRLVLQVFTIAAFLLPLVAHAQNYTRCEVLGITANDAGVQTAEMSCDDGSVIKEYIETSKDFGVDSESKVDIDVTCTVDENNLIASYTANISELNATITSAGYDKSLFSGYCFERPGTSAVSVSLTDNLKTLFFVALKDSLILTNVVVEGKVFKSGLLVRAYRFLDGDEKLKMMEYSQDKLTSSYVSQTLCYSQKITPLISDKAHLEAIISANKEKLACK